jgi:ubiquitin-conjugating enzyme E2 H
LTHFFPNYYFIPNPTDPLNPEAAALMLKDHKKYETKVKDYVSKYACANPEPQKGMNIEKEDIEEKVLQLEEEAEEQIDIENNPDDQISLSDVSELSDTSDIGLME